MQQDLRLGEVAVGLQYMPTRKPLGLSKKNEVILMEPIKRLEAGTQGQVHDEQWKRESEKERTLVGRNNEND